MKTYICKTKHKGKRGTVWHERAEDGRAVGWVLEQPPHTEVRARKFAELMHWCDRNAVRIEYGTVIADIGALDKEMPCT